LGGKNWQRYADFVSSFKIAGKNDNAIFFLKQQTLKKVFRNYYSTIL